MSSLVRKEGIASSGEHTIRSGNRRSNAAFVDTAQRLLRGDQLSDLDIPLDAAVGSGPNHTTRGLTAYRARNPGVRFRRTFPKHPPEMVAPVGLNHGVAVVTGDEAGTEADDEGRHPSGGVERLLG